MDTEANTSKASVLSVVVPAYNEQKTITIVLKKLLALDCVKEVVVVDDGSQDATCQLVKELNSPLIRLIEMPSNQGKTAAVSRGIIEVRGEITTDCADDTDVRKAQASPPDENGRSARGSHYCAHGHACDRVGAAH